VLDGRCEGFGFTFVRDGIVAEMLLTGEDDLSFLQEEYTYEMAEKDIYERHRDDKFVCQVRGQNYRVEARETEENELEYTMIRGQRYETRPDYYIKHDYAPAYEYVRQYQNYVTKGLIRLPPPFEPVVKSVAQGGDSLYEFVYALTVAFDARYDNTFYDKYNKRKNRTERKGKNAIQFTSTTQVDDGVLGLVFNPFSSYASGMIREINYIDDAVQGKYEYCGKIYKFEWQVHHGMFVVNSDIWSQIIETTMELTAFSLVCKNDIFGTYFMEAKEVQPKYIISPLISTGQDTKFDVGTAEGTVHRVPGVTANIQVVHDRFLPVEYDGQVSLELTAEGCVADVWTQEVNDRGKSVRRRKGFKVTLDLLESKNKSNYVYQEIPGTAYVRYAVRGGGTLYVPNNTEVYDRLYLGEDSVMYRVQNGVQYEDSIKCDTKYYATNMCIGSDVPTVRTNMKAVFAALAQMVPLERFNWVLQSFWALNVKRRPVFFDEAEEGAAVQRELDKG